MSASQRITGKNLKVFWIDGGGTVDLSGDRRALDPGYGQNQTEGAAGNDEATFAVPTLKSYKATLTMLSTGSAGTAMMSRIKEGDSGTLVWGKQGTATGAPKSGFGALVGNIGEPMPYDDMIEITVDFAGRGGLVFDERIGATW